MNRYLERADHSCRLLTYQFEEIEDRPVAEIDQSWRRIYSALNCTPTAGFLQSDLDDDDFMLTDSFTLADDLTFDRSNLNSILNCVENARENARQVRNVIGKQIWSEMNAAYLSLKEVRIEHIWNTQPRQFYLDFGSDIRTLFGVMDSSMYRDHGWQFSQLGRFVERVQLVASLIRSQYEVSSKSDTNSVVDWYSTLQVCEAALAYRRLQSVAQDRDSIARFLISDKRLSHSVGYSLALIKRTLDSISEDRKQLFIVEMNQRVKQMLVRTDEIISPDESSGNDVVSILNEILDSSRKLNDDIALAYFEYDVAGYLGT